MCEGVPLGLSTYQYAIKGKPRKGKLSQIIKANVVLSKESVAMAIHNLGASQASATNLTDASKP